MLSPLRPLCAGLGQPWSVRAATREAAGSSGPHWPSACVSPSPVCAPRPVAGSGSADTAVGREDADHGRGRRDVSFKVNALVEGVPTGIGDGGCTNWTAKPLANAKERLLTSGYGLDQLAALTALLRRVLAVATNPQ